MELFVSAIGTDSGKTLISAIFAEALEADYWKPIQSGNPRDTETVRSLVSNKKTHFWQETYVLNTPASPHASAKIDGVKVSLDFIEKPITNNHLIIEGAGGLLVPINDQDYVVDIAMRLKVSIILVCNLYLGSINHSLLSLCYLQQKGIQVRGLVFNGPSNPESERIIEAKSPWPTIMKIPHLDNVDTRTVSKYAIELKAIL
jgi:dethiobiotin synthetase